MVELEVFRAGPLIDEVGFWQFEIPVYLFLGGMTAGIMLISAHFSKVQEASRLGSFVSLFGNWVAQSGHAGSLFRSGTQEPFLSVLSGLPGRCADVMGILDSRAGISRLLGLGLANLHNDEVSWLRSLGIVKAFRMAGFVNWVHKKLRERASWLRKTNFILGAGLGIYTGILLETLGIARPLWNSLALGPLFLVSGLSTGAAVLMLLPLRHAEREQLVRMDIVAIWIELGLLMALIGDLVSGGGLAATFALSKILQGPYTALFWVLVVAVGLLIPLTFETLENRKQLKPSLLVPVFLLIGGFALRWIVVTAGQSVQYTV